eukprot:1443948-Pleurochrysis_carterae.AAC.5
MSRSPTHSPAQLLIKTVFVAGVQTTQVRTLSALFVTRNLARIVRVALMSLSLRGHNVTQSTINQHVCISSSAHRTSSMCSCSTIMAHNSEQNVEHDVGTHCAASDTREDRLTRG